MDEITMNSNQNHNQMTNKQKPMGCVKLMMELVSSEILSPLKAAQTFDQWILNLDTPLLIEVENYFERIGIAEKIRLSEATGDEPTNLMDFVFILSCSLDFKTSTYHLELEKKARILTQILAAKIPIVIDYDEDLFPEPSEEEYKLWFIERFLDQGVGKVETVIELVENYQAEIDAAITMTAMWSLESEEGLY